MEKYYIGTPIPKEIIIKCPYCGADVKVMTELAGIDYCEHCGQIINIANYDDIDNSYAGTNEY